MRIRGRTRRTTDELSRISGHTEHPDGCHNRLCHSIYRLLSGEENEAYYMAGSPQVIQEHHSLDHDVWTDTDSVSLHRVNAIDGPYNIPDSPQHICRCTFSHPAHNLRTAGTACGI